MQKFLSELKRRNVYRVAVLYLVVAWLILQVTDVLMDILSLPQWTGLWVFILLAIGFPVALILAWVFEFTAEGIELDRSDTTQEFPPIGTGRKLDFIIIGVLLVAVTYFAWNHDWQGISEQDHVLETSIAVLPFVNMSEDQSNEYFSDGISEEILNVLVGVEGLRVTSRTSSFSFKGQNIDLPTIARQLNVDHILEGSVRKDGNNVRITAQLIEVETDSHLWSQGYERQLEDIFAIQKDISASILRALESRLADPAEEIDEESLRLTTNMEAYEAFLRGKYQIHNRIRLQLPGLEEARLNFEEAIELDPNFAEAWAGLGASQVLHSNYSGDAVRAAVAQAEPALQRAIELDSENGMALASLGLLRTSQNRWAEADRLFHKALRVDSSFDTTSLWYGIHLSSVGKVERARDVLLAAIDQNPLSAVGVAWLASVYNNLGESEKAIETARRAIELGVGSSVSQIYLNHLLNEEWDLAIETMRQYLDSFTLDEELAVLLVDAILDPDAIPEFHNEIQQIRAQAPLFFHGWMYYDLNDRALLLDVIADHGKDGNLMSVLYRAWEPKFTDLRNDNGFARLMEENGLMQYWRETGWPDSCQQSTSALVCD